MSEIKPIDLEPYGDIKTELLQVRITEDEKNYLASEAQKLRISISAFTRMMILYWKGEIKHP